jgi:hypothetical protein
MAADHDHDVWVGDGFVPQCWRMESSLRATVTWLNCGWRRASRPPISTEVRVQSSALLITHMSMMRTVRSATSVVSARPISRVNPLPGSAGWRHRPDRLLCRRRRPCGLLGQPELLQWVLPVGLQGATAPGEQLAELFVDFV